MHRRRYGGTAYTLVCTGRYKELFHGLYESFIRHIPEGRLVVFTDDPSYFRGYVRCRFVYTGNGPWPYIVMNRYRILLDHADEFAGFDRIVQLQANMRLLRRPHFGSAPVTLCHHPCGGEAKRYVCGGLTCGDREAYLGMARWVQAWLDANPADAMWHDETALNAWWRAVSPDCEVLPECTMYPEEAPHMRTDGACIVLADKRRFFGCGKEVYAGEAEARVPHGLLRPGYTDPVPLAARLQGEGAVALCGRLGNQLWQVSAGLVKYGHEGLLVSPPQDVRDRTSYTQCLHGLRETGKAAFESFHQHRKWLAPPSDVLRYVREPKEVPRYDNILHLRLGDYKLYGDTRERIMGPEDIEGYLDLLGLRPRDVTVLSDGNAMEVRDHLPKGRWDIAPPMGQLEAFWAMMRCRRLICSASTFSYWAAYLKEGHPDDFVMHPVWTDSLKGDDPSMFKSFHDLMFWRY